MSDEQHALQQELVERYERLRSQKVDPREDNALNITTDGRKLATDARMLSATAPDFPESKVNRLVENVAAIWERTAATRGTQMIFADMGVHPTPWGYSAYDDIIQKLIARGIPREQIAAIGDAESDAKKQALFEKVRQGSVRVLIGSTQKMGTGTNVQKRLVALHHLDAPWKPAEVEQREGRILRQGNENRGSGDLSLRHGRIVRRLYVAGPGDQGPVHRPGHHRRQRRSPCRGHRRPGTFLCRGQGDRIGQSGGPDPCRGRRRVATPRLAQEESSRRTIRRPPQRAGSASDHRQPVRAVCPSSRPTRRPRPPMPTIRSQSQGATAYARTYQPFLAGQLDALPRNVRETTRIPLGIYRGLRFGIVLHSQFPPDVYLEGAVTRQSGLSREHQGPRAVLNALERLANAYGTECVRVRQDLAIAESQLRDYQARLGKPFLHDAYLSELTSLRDQLKAGLSATAQVQGDKAKARRCPNLPNGSNR